MGRVAAARAKWVAKTGPAKAPRYCEGVAAFLGVARCNPIRERRWGEATGKDEVAALWEKGYRAAMAG